MAIWKPVTPQPNACASGCTFSVTQRTSTCTSTPVGCTFLIPELTANCTAGFWTAHLTNLPVGADVRFRTYDSSGTLVANGNLPIGPTSTNDKQFGLSVAYAEFYVADNPSCVRSAVNPCTTPVTNYYCSSGNCAPASSAPAGSSGPYTTLAACQAACSSPGCIAQVYPPDDFSPRPPAGSTLNQTAVAGVAWGMLFSADTGVTFSSTGMPAGMTGTQIGTVYDIAWASPVVGTYTFNVTGSKAGCTSTTYQVRLQVTASGASCSTLSIVTAQGTSAYAPTNGTTFNAAGQLLVTTVTGPVGGTYTLNGTGTVNGAPFSVVSAVQTIGAGGSNTFSAPLGQHVDYDVTWSIVPAGASPITVCPASTPIQIIGSTCIVALFSQNATGYVLTVAAPGGAIAVPFTVSFGGPAFGGSALCADDTFGVVNTALTTDSAGGGNQFIYNVTGLPSGYTAAVKVSLNPGTSQLSHQMCGTTCFEVSIP